jgi:hypothetical protein
MGFKRLDNDGEGGYSLFNDGDNAVAKSSKIEVDVSTYQGDFQGYELELRFDAVEEVNEETRGVIPYWPNSKITIADTEQHTSNLAKLLQVAGITEDVLKDLGASDEMVSAVMSGEQSFRAESSEENEALAKALLKHLPGKVFRVSTKQRQDSDGEATYSQVDRVLGLKDDAEDMFESFDVDIDLDHPEHDVSSDSGSVSEQSDDSDDGDGEEVIFDDQ